MGTDLRYLDDTFAYLLDSKITTVGTDERGSYFIADKTIFYPQGGGQPSDTGLARFGSNVVPIVDSRFIEGDVRHYMGVALQEVVAGKAVVLEIDRSRRLRNSSSHTAGHLIAQIVEDLHQDIVATKGHHFPGESYIEFSGKLPTVDGDFAANIAEACLQDCSAALSVHSEQVSFEELGKRCRHVPAGIPAGKPLRVVTIGSKPGIPCGGTHMSSTDQISNLKIESVKITKGVLRVRYSNSFSCTDK